MSEIEALREMRRAQGVRVANASRGKRPDELERYRALDRAITRREADAEDPRRAADIARDPVR